MEFRDKAHAKAVLDQQQQMGHLKDPNFNPVVWGMAHKAVTDFDSSFNILDSKTWSSLRSILGMQHDYKKPSWMSSNDNRGHLPPSQNVPGGRVDVDLRAIDEAMDGMPDATEDPGYYNEDIDLRRGGQVSSGLNNLYMNKKNDSKSKLYNMMGLQERQYGGGLDDAYMNRRRSNAFADPNATSAFASPISQGGLPTIYRASGSGISDEDLASLAEFDQADADAGAASLADDAPNYATVDETGRPSEAASRAADLINIGNVPSLGSRKFHENKFDKEGYEPWQVPYLNNLASKYGMPTATSMLASAMATQGGAAGMKAGFQDGYSFGGAEGTLQDLLETGTDTDLGLKEWFKNRKKPKEKEGIEGLIEKGLDVVSLTRNMTPENITALNNMLADKTAKFTPNNKFMAGVVSTAVPTPFKVGISVLGGEKTVGTIETRDGLSYQVGDRGGLTLNMPDANIDYGHDPEVKEEEVVTETLPDTPEEVSSMDINRSLEKKSRADPNVEIIMKMYNLTEEEANKWLGNKG